jgi:hypothetical protein
LAHSCGEGLSLQAAGVRKALFRLGFAALMTYGAQTLNCRIEQG